MKKKENEIYENVENISSKIMEPGNSYELKSIDNIEIGKSISYMSDFIIDMTVFGIKSKYSKIHYSFNPLFNINNKLIEDYIVLNNIISKYNNEKKSLEISKNNLKDETKYLEEEKKKLAEENDDLKKDISNSKKEQDELKKELETKKMEKETENDNLKKLKEKLAKLEKDNFDYTVKSNLIKTLEELKTGFIEFSNKYENNKTSLGNESLLKILEDNKKNNERISDSIDTNFTIISDLLNVISSLKDKIIEKNVLKDSINKISDSVDYLSESIVGILGNNSNHEIIHSEVIHEKKIDLDSYKASIELYKYVDLKKFLKDFHNNIAFINDKKIFIDNFTEGINDYRIMGLQPNPTWNSFKDLWNAGLDDLWISAHDVSEKYEDDKDYVDNINHILIINNCNLSIIEAYAGDILDIVKYSKGILKNRTNPFTKNMDKKYHKYPENLYILFISINDENQDYGLPINPKFIDEYSIGQ